MESTWVTGRFFSYEIRDEQNIAIMHSFVDQLEFTNLGFVDALRTFLQSFRLPGMFSNNMGIRRRTEN